MPKDFIEEKRKEVERFRKSEMFEEAIAACNEIISIDSDCYLAYSDRGRIFHALGKYDLAFFDVEKLMELRPESPSPYYTRAKWNLEIGENQRAVEDASFIINTEDKYFLDAAYFYRAVAFFGLGNKMAAIKDCMILPDDFSFAVKTPKIGGKILSRDDLYRMLTE